MFGIPCVHQMLYNKHQLLENHCKTNKELYDTYLLKGWVNDTQWAYFESNAEGMPLHNKK